MAPSRTKANSSGLGKAIINRRAKDAITPKESQLYTLDESNPLQSVTHERDLDEFLANAALADQDFTTDRSKARIIQDPNASTSAKNPYLLSKQEEEDVKRKQVDLQHGLTIPRRPPWTKQTSRVDLEKQERESFLDWRRQLAQLAEASNLLLTPFERNLQLWRQLWRVLERSHLIVQIVDARNPLGFRSIDLERYVKEIGEDSNDQKDVTVPGKGRRKSLLLINKADLMTHDQRQSWAGWFDENDIAYAFFSAKDAAIMLEQVTEAERDSLNDTSSEWSEDDETLAADETPVDRNVKSVDTIIDIGDKQATLVDGELLLEPDSPGDRQELATEDKQRKEDANIESNAVQGLNDQVSASEESIRTRVLTVDELEELFIRTAPALSDFATVRDPTPNKLVVGLVGYPNVGKSSTINALLGAKKVSVSSTPGKTKHFQTLMLSDEITLCDCPGLVFPQFANTQADMVVDGILPIDQMREYSAPCDLVCQRIPKDILEGTYGIGIDVKSVEDGGTGIMTWEELLSTYAIARGMTRASFGMPDTSRAARYVLKDYVNAKLVYAHPPPGFKPEEYMKISRHQTRARLDKENRKHAPTTHVSKNADTYVHLKSSDGRQLTNQSIKSTSASAPMRTNKEKSNALDDVYFASNGPAPRPVIKGRNAQVDAQDGGIGYSRSTLYPHQRMLGPDGMPLVLKDMGMKIGGKEGKKHYKRKEGKKRSGRGYD